MSGIWPDDIEQFNSAREIAELINQGAINNLADIDWERKTDNWNLKKIELIIRSIKHGQLKEATLLAIQGEVMYKDSMYSPRGIDNLEKITHFLDDLLTFHAEGYNSFSIESITKKKAPRPKKTKTLPAELNTDKGRALLEKAIKAGLCDEEYNWKKSKALLAYFASKASEFLELGKGLKGNSDDRVRTSWKPFETLFKQNGLSGSDADYKKTGALPEWHEIVDGLFSQVH